MFLNVSLLSEKRKEKLAEIHNSIRANKDDFLKSVIIINCNIKEAQFII